IIFLFMYICERVMEKVCIKNIKEDTSLMHWDLLIFLPVIGVIMEFALILFDVGSRYAGVVVSAGIICMNLSVFYICDELAGAYMKLKERAFVEQQLASYSNQLNVVMRSEEKVRGLQHDLKNHLSEILAMAEGNRTQEIKAYVRNMQEDMTNEKEHVSSGNADVDSLINLKLEQAKSELENVRCKVSVPQGLAIQAFDWNIILGNLLDNAIQAARESDGRFLHIKIYYQQGMLFISIKNSYSGRLIKSGDRYLSTKEDSADDLQMHGLGIKNVKRIVEKYDGKMEINDRDGIFDVRILMYVSVKKEP
ncbi:MAG: ATP-binding protein, partial [Lachnospiraceae bacterium]|nr:ATP-binding protein [Lachnospiraceae bacterium]